MGKKTSFFLLEAGSYFVVIVFSSKRSEVVDGIYLNSEVLIVKKESYTCFKTMGKNKKKKKTDDITEITDMYYLI
jgi:hypothetical protein